MFTQFYGKTLLMLIIILALPNQQIPVLEVDGKQLGQSCAIVRFLAKRFKLAGRDEFEEAKADELFWYLSI